jgi:hypothetical protein
MLATRGMSRLEYEGTDRERIGFGPSRQQAESNGPNRKGRNE